MKKLFVLLIFICSFFTMNAQETYTVDGTTYELKTEVSGALTLLWNSIDSQYRYFVKQGNTIQELVNSKGDDGKYKEEYKALLESLTGNNSDKVKLTLPSLKKFITNYNTSIDGSIDTTNKTPDVSLRLMGFGGITNHPYVDNPDNTNLPQFGLEAEVFGATNTPRHALYLGLSHALESDDFEYSNTQLYLGYRFRFINAERFSLYANTTVATYNFTKATNTYILEDNSVVVEKTSNNNFDAPFSFGIGGDIKICKNSYITLMYNELVAIFLDNEGNFSTNFVLGYKFTL